MWDVESLGQKHTRTRQYFYSRKYCLFINYFAHEYQNSMIFYSGIQVIW